MYYVTYITIEENMLYLSAVRSCTIHANNKNITISQKKNPF